MGSSSSKKETSNIDRIQDIDEDELDLSNIDKLQIKALKEHYFTCKGYKYSRR